MLRFLVVVSIVFSCLASTAYAAPLAPVKASQVGQLTTSLVGCTLGGSRVLRTSGGLPEAGELLAFALAGEELWRAARATRSQGVHRSEGDQARRRIRLALDGVEVDCVECVAVGSAGLLLKHGSPLWLFGFLSGRPARRRSCQVPDAGKPSAFCDGCVNYFSRSSRLPRTLVRWLACAG